MSTHRYFNQICGGVLALTLLLTMLHLSGKSLGISPASQVMGYQYRLFDTSLVHSLDIVMDDWEGFLDTCENEEYSLCSVVIDGEACQNVGIRAKGNTSLTQVASYGNDRYSFKIEFDHYDSGKNYYGLDKLSLNNLIQDNTYLKDYFCYRMMSQAGVKAPLCSYVSLTVNGRDWGLYLAVEGIEEAFLQRNYGSGYGRLYKPDSMSFGGGRGNGGQFNLEEWQNRGEEETANGETPSEDSGASGGMSPPGGMPSPDENPDSFGPPGGFPSGDAPGESDGEDTPPGLSGENSVPDFQGGFSGMPQNGSPPEGMPENMPENLPEDLDEAFGNGGGPGRFGGFGGTGGNEDVSLIYTDDEYSSYQNIFDNAKTPVSDSDKDRLISSLKQLNAGENLSEVVDAEQVIRYFVAHNFVCNFDSYTGSMIHNYYLYEDGGQLSMLPWDYNLAFGGFMGAQDATALVNYPIDTPVSGGTVESRPMLAWIFSSEEYTQMYHRIFGEFLADYFQSGLFAQELDQVQAMIAPYVEKDPTKFCSYEEFTSGAAALKEFCLLRAESISGQLDGSIPSTSSGQSQDASSLVDASQVDVSAMGTMQNGGGMAPGRRDGQTAPSRPSDSSGDSAKEPSGRFPAGPGEEGAAEAPQGFSLEDGAGGTARPSPAGSWLLLGISGVVLAAGLLAVLLYRKRA